MTYRPNGLGKHWSRGKHFAPRRPCEICGRQFYAPPALLRRGGGRFCSVPCRASWQMTKGNTIGKFARRGKRIDLSETAYFKSSWEANWARYLNWQKALGAIEAWEYEPQSFPLNINGERRVYTPDFRVTTESGIEYQELKGVMDERSAAKIAAFREQYDEPLFVIGQQLYETVQWQLGVAVPHWEIIRVRDPRRFRDAAA